MEDTIKNIYYHFCDIEKIDDKTIEVSVNQQSLCMDGSVPLVEIILQDDGKYFISDKALTYFNLSTYFELSNYNVDSDKFDKIATNFIKKINKEYKLLDIKFSLLNGCIFAENIDIEYLSIAIEEMCILCYKIYHKYKKLRFT